MRALPIIIGAALVLVSGAAFLPFGSKDPGRLVCERPFVERHAPPPLRPDG